MKSRWNRYLRGALALGMLVAGTVTSTAQGLDERYLWKFTATAGLNSDGWEWDAGIAFVPFEYVSVKFAIGMAGEVTPVSEWNLDWIYDDDYYYDDYYYDDYDDATYTTRFKFMPSIEFKTPPLLRWKSQDATFHLFASPGVILSPGASGSRCANWCTWQVRGGLEMDIYRLGLQIGYGYSSFSLYSGAPYSYNGLPDNLNKFTHSGFVSMSWRF